jgi:superfamily I DNA/RNA helicase
MSSEDARTLANSVRGCVVAPAGCGKTFLLAEAVSISDGRQLILTHTHAGVRAIRGHLERREVPPAKYGVITIDGLALRYATSYPTLSGWTTTIPVGSDWQELRSDAITVFKQKAIRRVLAASYSGIFVDEYQDCTLGQHSLIQCLAEFLPVRVVGDPLQSIFAAIGKDDFCSWRNVEATFEKVGELSTPHRWLNTNQQLGSWLLSVRKKLIDGEEIDLQNAPLVHLPTTLRKDEGRIKACYSFRFKKGESQIGLRKWGAECHHLARFLGGSYRSMETVECEDLLKWTQRIQTSRGIQRAIEVLDFAEVCIARIPGNIKKMVQNPRRKDNQRVLQAIHSVAASSSLEIVIELMDSICSLQERIVIARRELWTEMKRAIKEHQANSSISLQQTAWEMRNRLRQFGGSLDRSALGTPLLVKGLEFDHAIILDAADHTNAESLYVSLTRGSKSLTILSDQAILKRAKPLFVLEPPT